MIRDLPSTSTSTVVKELLRLRNDVGAMAMGRVLTLIVSVDEDDADAALQAANDATRLHPARIVVVVSANSRGKGRLDAQIRVGGDAGASEIVVLRLYGDLTRQQAAVVTPLLPRTFTGAGDLTAAVFLAHRLRGADLLTALAETAGAVFGVLRVTVEVGESELALVQAQDELVTPTSRFEVTRLR